ncbi:TipJ family phage tail tip protein, partial [Pseudomonas viridiflava]|uniref:TipJ family phage tail tip protein n=1 Tax=Pseudomonas viridiflava TaxID=33069 RepID=UPI0019D0CB33
VDLPEGFSSALIRVRRLTPNRHDSNIADVMRISGLTEVIDAKLRYPNLEWPHCSSMPRSFRTSKVQPACPWSDHSGTEQLRP